jgi:hypothetical protein
MEETTIVQIVIIIALLIVCIYGLRIFGRYVDYKREKKEK